MSTTHNNYTTYKQYQDPEYKIVNDQVVRFSDICVHEFTMGDVEDPDLYAAQPFQTLFKLTDKMLWMNSKVKII